MSDNKEQKTATPTELLTPAAQAYMNASITAAVREVFASMGPVLASISAFLGAFRTVVFRLNGVTKNRLGQKARREHQEVDLLVHKANIELHGDGVVIHPQFTVNDYIFSNPWTSNWAPDEGRWAPNWQSHWAPEIEQTPLISLQDGWRFHDRPEDLIELCRAGMDALEKYLGDVSTRSA